MRTPRTLKPGQRGTRDLVARHGANLVCVRYRYDEDTREHLKTVELVVSRRSRERELQRAASGGNDSRAAAASRRVALRIGLRERELQRQVKSAGGRWDPVSRVWILKRDVAERLDLLHRVVGGGVSIWKPGVQIWKPQGCLNIDTEFLDMDTSVYIRNSVSAQHNC